MGGVGSVPTYMGLCGRYLGKAPAAHGTALYNLVYPVCPRPQPGAAYNRNLGSLGAFAPPETCPVRRPCAEPAVSVSSTCRDLPIRAIATCPGPLRYARVYSPRCCLSQSPRSFLGIAPPPLGTCLGILEFAHLPRMIRQIARHVRDFAALRTPK